MGKSDKDHARQLLDMANKDHSALSHMLDSASFSDEVFGFHAQQTIEKALKAWIAVRRLVYPKSHDVSALVKILRDEGQDLSNFQTWKTILSLQFSIDTKRTTAKTT
jgi:HEPN domain-containing protein